MHTMRLPRYSLGLCLLTALFLAACAYAPKRIQAPSNDDFVSFVRDANATRATVVERLGEPDLHYDDQRIVIYNIKRNGREFSQKKERQLFSDSEKWQLVIIYDEQDRVARHSLVRVGV